MARKKRKFLKLFVEIDEWNYALRLPGFVLPSFLLFVLLSSLRPLRLDGPAPSLHDHFDRIYCTHASLSLISLLTRTSCPSKRALFATLSHSTFRPSSSTFCFISSIGPTAATAATGSQSSAFSSYTPSSSSSSSSSSTPPTT